MERRVHVDLAKAMADMEIYIIQYMKSRKLLMGPKPRLDGEFGYSELAKIYAYTEVYFGVPP